MAARKAKPKVEAEADGMSPGTLLGGPPVTRAQMQTTAKTEASARGLDAEHTAHHVAARLDQYDTWFSRDPGRANGPYS